MTDTLNPEALEKAREAVAKQRGLFNLASDRAKWIASGHAYNDQRDAVVAITAYLAALPRTDLVERLSDVAKLFDAKRTEDVIFDGTNSQKIAALLRQAAAVISATGGVPDGWRTIERAPKDGTRILLAKIVGHPDHPTALWWATVGMWSARWSNWNDGIEPCGLAEPTHWMPISAHGVGSTAAPPHEKPNG